ncbi:MAG: 4-hydroxythreonine-4-phosphate dehydrogenase PdxA [Lentisphaerae bacterium]|nr:4-hydroxythreonine-4-phosphate dehydrogenase PdxA [Lentisphaerota bacterium]
MRTIAITLGDPGGIGPEVALKALYRKSWPGNLRFVLIGSRAILRRQARQLSVPLPPEWHWHDALSGSATIVNWEPEQERNFELGLRYPSYVAAAPARARPGVTPWPPEESRLAALPDESTPSPARSATRSVAGGRARLQRLKSIGFKQPPMPLTWQPGVTGKAQARSVVRWIQAAVQGCRAGHFAALVTGPICKQSLALAGLPFAGHTEYLAALTLTRRYAMLLLGGSLRVVLVTRHLPLAKVPGAVSRSAIRMAAQLAAQALPWLGIKQKTIGVCALNPHAGDEGLLGREEIKTIIPALRSLRRQGLSVEGPIAGDVIFHQARQGRYGAILAMYHDQGLAPLKMLAFDEGVNVTLGLPIVRTSPDHGTAFDIAGKGQAHAGSMAAAIRLAARLAYRRNPWGRAGAPGRT